MTRDANEIAREYEHREREAYEMQGKVLPSRGAATMANAIPPPRGTLKVWVSAGSSGSPSHTVTGVELQVKDESIIAYNEEGEAHIFSLRSYAHFTFTPDRAEQ